MVCNCAWIKVPKAPKVPNSDFVNSNEEAEREAKDHGEDDAKGHVKDDATNGAKNRDNSGNTFDITKSGFRGSFFAANRSHMFGAFGTFMSNFDKEKCRGVG